jgi:hypothetical protein
MAKLKLDVETIEVESFALVAERKPEVGTVNGYGKTNFPLLSCMGNTCVGGTDAGSSCEATYCGGTCEYSCLQSCGDTCLDTCGGDCSVNVCS